MKIILTMLLFFSLLLCSAFADERETFISKENITHGGFGGPLVKATRINDSLSAIAGGKGAWLINHTLYLGGGLFGTLTKESGTQYALAYSGPIIGYIVFPEKVVHLSLELLVGDGDLIDIDSLGSDSGIASDSIIVLEPSAYISVNIASFATLNIGASYRYLVGSDTEGLSNSELGGLAGEINVMFGRF
jgi:hypothetical protein